MKHLTKVSRHSQKTASQLDEGADKKVVWDNEVSVVVFLVTILQSQNTWWENENKNYVQLEWIERLETEDLIWYNLQKKVD